MSTELMSRFLEQLYASRLFDRTQIEELLQRPEAAQGDVEGLERLLLDRGWLTRYQLEEIKLGRGERLLFNGYRLQAPLGEDSSGAIFQAIHPSLNTPVQIKFVRPEWLGLLQSGEEYVARVREASVIAHPHLVAVLDTGIPTGIPYVVSELLDGVDLGYLVNEMGAVPVPLACEYIRQAAYALDGLHQKGICHGDFSPAAMILSPVLRKYAGTNGSSKVQIRPASGALVKVQSAGQVPLRPPLQHINIADTAHLGHVDYVAPERLIQTGFSVAGDVYSLGATLYYLLAARPPHDAKSPTESLLSLQSGVPPTRIDRLRRDVPQPLGDLVQRMLSWDPSLRPQTMGEVIAALQPFCAFNAASPAVAHAVPIASATMTGPAAVQNAYPMAVAVEPPLAEALPGVEPMPDGYEQHAIVTPQTSSSKHQESHFSFSHHEESDAPGAERSSGERRRSSSDEPAMSHSTTFFLLIIAVVLHIGAYALLAWYFEIWPFSGSSSTTSEETPAEEPRNKKKRREPSKPYSTNDFSLYSAARSWWNPMNG